MAKLTTGERIEELRRAQGLTLKELSDEIKAKTGQRIAVSTLSDLEASGKVPRLSTLKAIANYFMVSLDYLAGISEVKSPNIKLQAVHKMLGLSESGIMRLQEANNTRMLFVLSALDELLKDDALYTLDLLGQYLTLDKNPSIELVNREKISYTDILPLLINQELSRLRYQVQQRKDKEQDNGVDNPEAFIWAGRK